MRSTKKTKYVIALFMTYAMTLGLMGCGGGSSTSTPKASSLSSAAVSSSTASSLGASSLQASSLEASSLQASSVEASSSSLAASSRAAALTGVFIDSAVAGIHYETSPGGFSGETSSTGEFNYAAGDTIIFSIGNLVFPAVAAKDVVTPLDIANTTDPQNQIAINIAALLQSLDTDSNPDNGISINYSSAASNAQTINFDLPYDDFAALTSVVNLTANSGSSNTALVSRQTALAHIQASLNKINTAPLIGTWITESEGLHYVLFILDSHRYAVLTYEGNKGTFEQGTYNWDNLTRMVTTTNVASTGSTPTTTIWGNEYGIADIDEHHMTLGTWGGVFNLSRLASATNPLIGGWVLGESVVAFTENHYFQGQNGAEYGTYALNNSNITFQTLTDTNDDLGFSHPCNIVESYTGNQPNDLSCGPNKSNINDTFSVNSNTFIYYSAANVIANETNASPRNDNPESSTLNKVVKNEFEIYSQPHPLAGEWELAPGGETLIFSGFNTYTQIKPVNDDPNCRIGTATGYFNWDPKTFAFNITLTSNGLSAPGDDCSIKETDSVRVNGNQLILHHPREGDYIFTKKQ